MNGSSRHCSFPASTLHMRCTSLTICSRVPRDHRSSRGILLMRMASHTTLARLPARPAHKAVVREAHIPDAALPCRLSAGRLPAPASGQLGEPARPLRPRRYSGSRSHGRLARPAPQYLVLLRTARDLCASCPLWAECLQDAVAYAEPYAYTAATTREDRRALRRMLDIGDENGDLLYPRRGPLRLRLRTPAADPAQVSRRRLLGDALRSPPPARTGPSRTGADPGCVRSASSSTRP